MGRGFFSIDLRDLYDAKDMIDTLPSYHHEKTEDVLDPANLLPFTMDISEGGAIEEDRPRRRGPQFTLVRKQMQAAEQPLKVDGVEVRTGEIEGWIGKPEKDAGVYVVTGIDPGKPGSERSHTHYRDENGVFHDPLRKDENGNWI